eukprot:187963-Chlamydomonas_euryale.AAC.1
MHEHGRGHGHGSLGGGGVFARSQHLLRTGVCSLGWLIKESGNHSITLKGAPALSSAACVPEDTARAWGAAGGGGSDACSNPCAPRRGPLEMMTLPAVPDAAAASSHTQPLFERGETR